MLSTPNAERCSNEVIIQTIQTCSLYRDICITLDCLASKFQMKNGELQAEDYEIAEKAPKNLAYLWKMAYMSFTPKIHCLLAHTIHQMRCFNGIVDTLKDFLEHMHQISARVEACVSCMKDKDTQALVHSKMEVIQFKAEVTDHIEQSKQVAKRSFKKRNPELCAATRAVKLKKEQDEVRWKHLFLWFKSHMLS